MQKTRQPNWGNNILDESSDQEDDWLARPFCLVSLLEIMKKVHAESFAVVSSGLQSIISFGGFKFKYDDPLLKTCLNELLVHFDYMGCSLSSVYLKQMRATILQPNATGKQLEEMAKVLQGRFEDELAQILFFVVPYDRAKFYSETNLFGENVTKAFPSAIFNIEEAGKCFALSRNTACVMHLAKVVEIGLKAVRTCLKLPPLPVGKQQNWGDVLRQIWDETGARNKAADPAWMTQQKSFFENAHADLSSVKNAWRNPSMHADLNYDSERAEDIFSMTKSFMRHLAEHVNESGVFTP